MAIVLTFEIIYQSPYRRAIKVTGNTQVLSKLVPQTLTPKLQTLNPKP